MSVLFALNEKLMAVKLKEGCLNREKENDLHTFRELSNSIITIKDKNYVNKIILDLSLSPSKLNYYLHHAHVSGHDSLHIVGNSNKLKILALSK